MSDDDESMNSEKAVPQDKLKKEDDDSNDVEINGEHNGVKNEDDEDDEDDEDKVIYKATTDLQSERKLALELGYPEKWHVTRIVPHPSSTSNTTCMDIIYCGDPSDTPDCYYNHNAALSRALEWKEGVSTGFECRGGQMLPRTPLYEHDEIVEVRYENDWFKAKVVQVKEYDDDIRYTVYYIGEDSTQSNVNEDCLRKRVVAKKKREKKAKTPKKTAKSTNETSQEDIDSALQLAHSFGLPEGWTAEPRIGGKFHIQSPDKQHTFRSKKTATDFILKQERTMKKISSKKTKKTSTRSKNEHDIAASLGLPSGWKAKHQYSITAPDGTTFSSLKRALQTIQPSPKPAKKQKTHVKERKSKKKGAIKSNDFTIVNRSEEDTGDPPWRRTGHELLGRFVRYNTQLGKITGWIKESDVDSSGTAAYISNKTNKPGRLFHINFKDGDLLFADFEEHEVNQLIVNEDEDDGNSSSNSSLNEEDSVPLSKMKR